MFVARRFPLRLEPLETRLTPSIAIAQALDLPNGAYIDRDDVRGNALAVIYNTKVGGLGNFPTGPNSHFLLLSNGDATRAYAPRGTYPADGLDWGIRGSADDQQFMTLVIPTNNGEGHMRFDVNFMTDEVPGVTNEFNDRFTILATPIGAGTAQTLAQVSVNDDVFLSTPPVNAIYARHTGAFTIHYTIPVGAVAVKLEIALDDQPFTFNTSRTGNVDSALAIDNFRFTKRQTVWLDFDGGSFVDYPVKGGITNFPAFQPSDIRSSADRSALINSIVAGVEAKYSAYDIDFTTTQPTEGVYSRMKIGGSGSNVITLTADADPRLTEFYGGSMTVTQAIGMNPFGFAESDYGNPDLDTPGVIFSKNFDTKAAYAGMAADELERRLVVTIAHEIAHSLGVPHVDDSFDDNIMAQFSPRSQYAYFEDTRRTLADGAKPLPDGRTELNVHGYLASVLGLADGTGVFDGPALSAVGRYFRFAAGINIFDLRIGVGSSQFDSEDGDDGGVKWYEFDQLHAGTNEIELPNVGPGSYITFYGSTTPGGPVDFFSGTPTAGTMTFADGFVPLFDTNGNLNPTLPAATGELGNLEALPNGVSVSVSPYTALGMQPIPKTGFTFTDIDGDTVTVKLASSRGTGLIQIIDPENDGRGTIGRIELSGTLPTDRLTIGVRKNVMTGGNGYTDVGAIVGSALGAIAAKTSNLVGEGVSITSLVKSMSFRDIRNGADIITGGNFNTTTVLAVHDVADGTTIAVDSRLRLSAARIGDGSIRAAMLTKLVVAGDRFNAIRGDFRSDVTIDPGRTLTAREKTYNLLGSAVIAGHTIGATFNVPGNVGTFRTGTFEQSAFFVGYTPTNPLTPQEAAPGMASSNWRRSVPSVTTAIRGQHSSAVTSLRRDWAAPIFLTSMLTIAPPRLVSQ